MIVPNDRLVWWAGGTLLPLTVAVAWVPAGIPLAGTFLAVLCAVILGDALVAAGSCRWLAGEFPERLRLTRHRDGTLAFALRHLKGRSCTLLLGLELPPEIQSPLADCRVLLPAGGGWLRLTWPLKGEVRGRFPLPRCHVRVVSPLGLWSGQTSLVAGTHLAVYPDLFAERQRLAPLFLGRDATPIHPRRQVGQGKEFEKLRAYLPGDSLADIHWKATAKRGVPVTKEHRIERTQEIYVAVDCSRLTARSAGEEGGDSILEQYITAALTLGMITGRQGDLFGLTTFSDRVHDFVRAGSGRGHFGVCRDLLHRLVPRTVSPDFGELATFLALRLRRRALVIILTSLDEPALAEQFARTVGVVSRRHLVLVTMLRPDAAWPAFTSPPPATRDELYRSLGGHLLWHSLAEQKETLRRRGVDFSFLDRGRLAADLVSRYIEVKRRQIL